MTARPFDLYDLSSPFVTPYPTQTATTTAQQARTFAEKLSTNRLFNASVIQLVFSSILYLIGTALDWLPFARVTGTENMALWLTVIAGGLAAAGAITALLVVTVAMVRQ